MPYFSEHAHLRKLGAAAVAAAPAAAMVHVFLRSTPNDSNELSWDWDELTFERVDLV